MGDAVTAPWLERRHAPRCAVGPAPTRLTLRPRVGPVLDVVELSAGGARVESTGALKPGSSLAMRPTGAAFDTTPMLAHGVYCRIGSLRGPEGVTYQSGLRFDASSYYPGPPHAHGDGQFLLARWDRHAAHEGPHDVSSSRSPLVPVTA